MGRDDSKAAEHLMDWLRDAHAMEEQVTRSRTWKLRPKAS